MTDAPIDETLAALDSLPRTGAGGSLTRLSPTAARDALDRWIAAMAGRETYAGIRGDLEALRDALAASPLDGPAIGRLLVRLGAQTRSAASVGDPRAAARIARLGGLLETAGTALTS